MPGVFMSTSRKEMPWCFGASGSVRASRTPVGVVRAGGPDLLAVDDVVVAIAHGARLQAGEVAAGARLAVALAPDDLAARDARQVLASSAPRCRAR